MDSTNSFDPWFETHTKKNSHSNPVSKKITVQALMNFLGIVEVVNGYVLDPSVLITGGLFMIFLQFCKNVAEQNVEETIVSSTMSKDHSKQSKYT